MGRRPYSAAFDDPGPARVISTPPAKLHLSIEQQDLRPIPRSRLHRLGRGEGAEPLHLGAEAGYFGGGLTPAADQDPETYRGLVEAFYAKFPDLHDLRIANLWGGPIDYSMRFSVFFERLHGGKAIYAGGYSGFGVAGSRFGARIAVALLQEDPLPELDLAMVRSSPPSIPPEPFRWIGIGITFRAVARLGSGWSWARPWLWLMRRMGYPLGH